MTNAKVQRKDVPPDIEIQEELDTASRIPSLFQRRRAEAVIALLETGKRRSEIAGLLKEDITTDQSFLYVRFTVRKKRKKSILTLQRTKKFEINSRLAQAIIRQFNFIVEKAPGTPYLFPRNKCFFGTSIKLDLTKPMTGQEVWRIQKRINPNTWCHLKRERRAVKVIRSDEKKYGNATIETVYKIKRVLDLEKEQTAWNYITRHEVQRVEEEEEAL